MPGSLNLNSLNKDDTEEVVWTIVEAICESTDTATTVVSTLRLLRDLYGAANEDGSDILPNPFMVANGHGGPSPLTRRYLLNRAAKSFGGSALTFGSGLATGVTQVDVGGIAQHANALGTTSVHLYGIRAAGSNFRKSQTVTRWVDAISLAKASKMGIRGLGMVGAATPVAGVSLGTGIASTIAKLGVKLTLGKLITRTAMELHWRSYQEIVIGRSLSGGGSGPCGPASAMFYEIFTKRGFTRIFGRYETEGIIREPGGWIALNDKLMLM